MKVTEDQITKAVKAYNEVRKIDYHESNHDE